MKVLLTGASGFIGRHLAAALGDAGHEVIALTRRPDAASHLAQIEGDFARDTDPAQWVPRLQGIDAVLNAVGILREAGTQTFAALHTEAPKALFSACVVAGVGKVIQISALGADAAARSRYHLSKRQADLHLQELPLAWIVLQPSLVFGTGGASVRFLATLAAGPLIPLPGAGGQRVQPVRVEDLAELCLRLLVSAQHDQRVIAVVGPQAFTVRGLLAELRLGMGLGEPRFLQVPMPAARGIARLAGWVPGVPLDSEALEMLERGNTAPAHDLAAILGREPRPVVPLALPARAGRPGSVADWARLNWLLPLVRLAVAVVWIVTGVLSLGVYPVDESYALLARVGLVGPAAVIALYGAALLDLALGIATLVLKRRVGLWRLQIAVIVGYTLIITFALPQFWLHPFGPVLKNVPLLATIVLLYALERRG